MTDAELELLIQNTDGYLLVTDAREKGKHITLSDADQLSIDRAKKREEQRLEKRKRDRDKRAKEIATEREELKKHKIERKKQQLLDLLAEMKGG